MTPIALTPEIEQLAREGAYFAFSVSGGKDGNIAAVEVNKYLDSVGHDRSRRIVIHADLGVIEWRDSLVMCREVSEHIDVPLKVVRNQTHDMISRWRQRFINSLDRYTSMSIVTLISPWSSASHRFCTAEMKAQVIQPELVKWAGPDAVIVSVIGIRGDESPNRQKQPIWQEDSGLVRTSKNIRGYTWRPIHKWSLDDVWQAHEEAGIRRHEAYTKFGSSRVSCAFCVMSSGPDLEASTSNPENTESYRRVVKLEMESGFSFQGQRWLGDVRPDLMPPDTQDFLAIAKARRAERVRVESLIPQEMLYVKGWPTYIPDLQQCELLCGVRRQVCEMYGIESAYLTAETIQARYTELYHAGRAKERKQAEKKARSDKRAAKANAGQSGCASKASCPRNCSTSKAGRSSFPIWINAGCWPMRAGASVRSTGSTRPIRPPRPSRGATRISTLLDMPRNGPRPRKRQKPRPAPLAKRRKLGCSR